MEATLVNSTRVTRTLEVTTPTGCHVVEYLGNGAGFESVRVDGQLVARESGRWKMVPRLDFSIGPTPARVEIEAGLLLNLLGVFCGKLSAFRLYVNDQLIYQDGDRSDPSAPKERRSRSSNPYRDSL